MGSKKRSKTKLEGGTATANRKDHLRGLFDGASSAAQPNQTRTEMTKAVHIDMHTRHQAGAKNQSVASFATPTPTPTVPTEVPDSRTGRKSQTHVYDKTQTHTPAPVRTVISTEPYRAAKKVAPGARDLERKTDWWLGPLLVTAALLMLGLGWLHIERSGTIAHPIGHTTSTLEAVRRETQDKINFYRQQLGHRLNRDRVNIEILNNREAPKLDAAATPKLAPSMMNGVPLMQEGYVERNYGPREGGDNNVRYTSRDQTQPVPIDRPDARIQYGLQEEQHRAEFDRRVQQQYIREFIENARRDGVNVILDGEANVVGVEPISGSNVNTPRQPGSYSPPTLSR